MRVFIVASVVFAGFLSCAVHAQMIELPPVDLLKKGLDAAVVEPGALDEVINAFAGLAASKARRVPQKVYRVEEDEVAVNSVLLRRIEFLRTAGRFDGRLMLRLRNTTTDHFRPNFTVEVYNRYGMLLGQARSGSFGDIIWPGTNSSFQLNAATLERSAVHRGDCGFYDYSKLLKHAGFKCPPDIDQPAYVAIADESVLQPPPVFQQPRG